MRRNPRFCLFAIATALLGSLSAPAQALVHGRLHGHLAQHHGGAEVGDHEHDQPGEHHAGAPEVAEDQASWQQWPGSDHAHGHPRFEAAPGARELFGLPSAHVVTALVPSVVAIRATLQDVRAPARTDRVLLARPDPERGPPPTLRAPPIR